MKKFLLVLLFLGLTRICFADASFKIIGQDIDNNGNIRVWAVHSVDGVEISSQYPKIKDAEGKEHFVYCTRYTKQNFKDCADKTAIEDYILNDIKNFSNVLTQKEFDKKAPKTLQQIQIDYNAAANQTFIDANLDTIVGKSVNTTEVTLKIDSSNTGVPDKELTITTSGTLATKAIAVEAPIEEVKP